MKGGPGAAVVSYRFEPQPLHFVQVRLCVYIPSPDPAQCGSLRH
nr:unnamed protein product [Digitaria exilis]